MVHLSVVSQPAATPGRTAIQLMAEAKAAGEQQVAALMRTLELAVAQANEIVEGGEVYPAGVRDAAARFAEHTVFKAQSISAIMRPASVPVQVAEPAEARTEAV
jgi:hypothetical protein